MAGGMTRQGEHHVLLAENRPSLGELILFEGVHHSS